MSLLIQIELDKLEKSLTTIEKKLLNLDAKLLYKVMFIVEEILTNLAHHAEFTNKQADVTLSVEENQTIHLTFKDNAKKFNILEYPDPNIEESIDERELGGLGIFLTKKYAKKIEYLYLNGYNILKISL